MVRVDELLLLFGSCSERTAHSAINKINTLDPFTAAFTQHKEKGQGKDRTKIASETA